MSTEALLDSLNRIDIHRTGILFSSWHYTKKIGDNIVSVTDSYRVIASVQAPMFALMPATSATADWSEAMYTTPPR